MRSAEELITKRPCAHGLPEFDSDFVQGHGLVDIVESTSLQSKIQNQSVSSHGKLTLVDPSSVGQGYRSCWAGDVNDLFGAHIVDFFVAQIHSARQSSGQGSNTFVRKMRTLDKDKVRRVNCGIRQIYADRQPPQAA